MSVPVRAGRIWFLLRHPWIRIGLGAALCAALTVLTIATFHWQPLAQEQREVDQRLNSARRAVIEARVKQNLLSAYRHAAQSVPPIEQKLSASVSQAELVKSLAQLARRHGVRLHAESYEEGRAVGAHGVIVANLGLAGSYASLRHFLAGLPELPMWVELAEARLEGARSGEHQVRAQFRLLAYRSAAGGARS